MQQIILKSCREDLEEEQRVKLMSEQRATQMINNTGGDLEPNTQYTIPGKMLKSQVENKHYSTVSGLIQLVIIISRMLY